MNQEKARQLVDETLGSDFDKGKFVEFTSELLRDELDTNENFQPLPTDVQGDFCYKYHERIESYEKIGSFADALDVLIIKLKRSVTLQRGRTSLREFAADYLIAGQGLGKSGVLAAFYSEGDNTWRFSYVKVDASLVFDENGNAKEAYQKSEAKRFSFLVGRNERTHTAQKQFIPLLIDGNAPTVEKIEKAFSIEVVTDAFFKDYDAIFKKVEKEVARSITDTKPNDTEAEEKRRLFTQRLFNRLMFINFLQKKGWLSFDGDTNYLRRLYTEAEKNKDENFFDDRLFWLFFSGLNASVTEDLHKAKKLEERRGVVPPLNGGLFEQDEDGFDERGKIHIENHFFGEILDLFELYNFTVDESTPTDIEVAVDPEMLGRVFEELVTGRHESGSYYTPRPIVSFMCRESLKHYLRNALSEPPAVVGGLNADNRNVKIYPSATADGSDIDAISEFVDEGKGENLRDARAILDALENIRVCDPACGSGAYLLGMMQELLRLREAVFVSKHIGSDTIYKRKREIIEHNIYGVDKDRFAVQIASLRLWLSLSIDSDEPRPLPNLKYKIGCGDSLLAPMEKDSNLFRSHSVEKFKNLKAEYSGANEPARKKEIETEIEHLRVEIAQSLHHLPEPPKPFQITLAEKEIQPLREKIQRCVNRGEKSDAEKFQKDLNKLLASIEEWKQQIEPKPYKPEFFDWTVEFAEVFTDGGFDVVLANPPFIRQELLGRDYKENGLKPIFPEVYSGTADIYVYFYARANSMLKPNGIGCFISSNKWLRAGYGEKLRQHLLDATKFHLVVDFGELPVFNAATFPAIFLWQNAPREDSTTTWAVVKDLLMCYAEGVREHIFKLSETLPASQFGIGKSRLASIHTTSFRETMEQTDKRLGNYVDNEFYRGVVTGLNKAFIISRETRDRIISEDEQSIEIIKSNIAGDDVRKYEIHFRESYLIYVSWFFDIEKYPAIYRYLETHKTELSKRPEVLQNKFPWFALSRYASDYVELFDKPKIIYPDIGKDVRFAMETNNYFGANSIYFVGKEDWFLLAVLNSTNAFEYLKGTCAALGDENDGGRLRFFGQYLETLPIPNAPDDEREAIAKLAKETQNLHTARRKQVEQFLLDIGTSAAESSSRNVLEKPWELSEAEFVKRTKSELLLPTFRRVKESTIHLTEQTSAIEHEIDQRVAELYGVKLETPD